MALFHANFFSDALGMQSQAEVILPDRIAPGRRVPVLYLLHGLSDDHTIWQRRTSIERYVENLNLAVVMPNGHRSFYADMAFGRPYFKYISEELPALMESYFPISRERSGRFAAGLSMGGYGAFKLALNCPEKYAAAASLSGVLDVAVAWSRNADFFPAVFGTEESKIKSAPDNLLEAARQLVENVPPSARPRLFQFCGTEDFLYENNLSFLAHTSKLGLEIKSHEGPGGHTWDVWDKWIQDVLAWLPIA